MKYKRSLAIVMSLFLVWACEDGSPEPNVDLEAEIIGQDFTRWICGGGWIIATNTDTVTVHEIPNEQVMAILASNNFTGDVPLKVRLSFEMSPESTCAREFGDRVRELNSISLR